MGYKDKNGGCVSRQGPRQDPAPFWVVVLLLSKITNSNISKCKAGHIQTNDRCRQPRSTHVGPQAQVTATQRAVSIPGTRHGPSHSHTSSLSWPSTPAWAPLSSVTHTPSRRPAPARSDPQHHEKPRTEQWKGLLRATRDVPAAEVPSRPALRHAPFVTRLSVASRPVRVRAGGTRPHRPAQQASDAPASRRPSPARPAHARARTHARTRMHARTRTHARARTHAHAPRPRAFFAPAFSAVTVAAAPLGCPRTRRACETAVPNVGYGPDFGLGGARHPADGSGRRLCSPWSGRRSGS